MYVDLIHYLEVAKTHRGSITKAGNRHGRKAIVSAAWKYAARPTRSHALKERQRRVSPHVVAISRKAQQRHYKRFHALAVRRPRSVAATAIAREFAGLLWEAMNTLTPGTDAGLRSIDRIFQHRQTESFKELRDQ